MATTYTIKKGDKGSQVVEIQKMLKQLGFLKDKIDGVFGVNTENAVKAFQKAKQIKVDGIIGPQTYGLLKQAYQDNLKKAQQQIPKDTIIAPIIKPAPRKVDSQNIKKTNIKYIVLHHSASTKDLSWEEIDKEHKARGFEGFGYHFYIEKNGTIIAGRALNKQAILESDTIEMGAQAKGINAISVGICFSGNFEVEKPTPAQIEAGKQLVKWLKYKVFNKPEIIGHKEAVKINPQATVTACPGKNFPLDDFKKI